MLHSFTSLRYVQGNSRLQKIKARVDAAKLAGKDEIGVRVGKIINQYKVAKHFELVIEDAAFVFRRTPASITAQAALDGIYIVRTSVPATHMAAADCVRNYKSLANVERAFRSFKTIDLKVRPIHHRLADRVRSHIFLCMLIPILLHRCPPPYVDTYAPLIHIVTLCAGKFALTEDQGQSGCRQARRQG